MEFFVSAFIIGLIVIIGVACIASTIMLDSMSEEEKKAAGIQIGYEED